MKLKYCLFCVVINILITCIVLFVLCGTWFDWENLQKRQDYEVYQIPLWQYIIYYVILLLSFVINVVLFNQVKRSSDKRGCFLGVFVSIYIIAIIIFTLLPFV